MPKGKGYPKTMRNKTGSHKASNVKVAGGSVGKYSTKYSGAMTGKK